ncbi:DNA excision repair protein ERCC-6-like 2 [Branchiostoma lanceolatum]|uniref:DNA excision repair protein ERCC-6-like 2 n=1 Tax=Branchiostoma lanceolatum TaxID=7740 RepID=UPI0034556DFE
MYKAKFAKLEGSDEEMSSPPPRPVAPQKYKPLKLGRKRSRPAVQGIASRGQDRSPCFSSSSTSSCLSSPRENKEQADSTRTGDHSFRIEGFSDEDYEKPFFRNHSHVGKKEPFLLSAAGKTPVVQIPATINRYLRDYQRDGVQFLYRQYEREMGAILGDDMGLGKTVQVISFLSAVLGRTGTREDIINFKKRKHAPPDDEKKVFLIVSPASVLYNWLDELETWGHFRVGKYHGDPGLRDEVLTRAEQGRLDVVITTYETLRRNLTEMNSVRFSWSAVIVDECHKIKEKKAKITKAMGQLRVRRRVGLTGTILQNNLMEMWCVLNWANPGCLGDDKDFRVKFMKPIEEGQKMNSTKRQLAEARRKAKMLSNLRKKWFIRRTKKIIADQLPTKDEQVVFCKLSDFQQTCYQSVLGSEDVQLVLHQNDPCDCNSGLKRRECCYKTNADGEKVKELMFSYLSVLLKVSNHVALLLPEMQGSKKALKRTQRVCDVVFRKHPHFVRLAREAAFRTLSDPKYCGKMQVLQQLLNVFHKQRRKVLVFSFYTKLLDIIEQYLMSTGEVYSRLDGSTRTSDRLHIVKDFNTNPNILLCLVSTTAGGLGLNFTGASVVILFEPTWNPANDQQAQDRAYRIGQRQDVRVYRLVTMGTIEENMYLRQVYKQQLSEIAVSDKTARRYFTGVAGRSDQQGEIFGISNMFALRMETSCLTRDLISRVDQIEGGLKVTKFVKPKENKRAEKESIWEEEDDGEETEENDEDQRMEEDEEEEKGTDYEDQDDRAIKSNRKRLQNDCDSSKKETRDRDPFSMHTLASQLLPEDDVDMATVDMATEKKTTPNNPSTSSENTDNDTDTNTAKTAASRRRSKIAASLSRRKKAEKKPQLSRRSRSSRQSFGEDIAEFSSSDSDSSPPQEKRRVGRLEVKVVKGKKPTLRRSVSSRKAVQGGKGKITRTVSDVFRECGVAYTHRSDKVVGGSKAEAHMSHRAMEDVYELRQFSQQPANFAAEFQDSSEESDDLGPSVSPHASKKKRRKAEVENSSTRAEPTPALQHHVCKINNKTVIVGGTPPATRREHFAALAKSMGCSQEELANKVLQASSESRLEMLHAFYKDRDSALGYVFQELRHKENTTDEKR